MRVSCTAPEGRLLNLEHRICSPARFVAHPLRFRPSRLSQLLDFARLALSNSATSLQQYVRLARSLQRYSTNFYHLQ